MHFTLCVNDRTAHAEELDLARALVNRSLMALKLTEISTLNSRKRAHASSLDLAERSINTKSYTALEQNPNKNEINDNK